jgi:hypothetical protein
MMNARSVRGRSALLFLLDLLGLGLDRRHEGHSEVPGFALEHG